MHDLENKKTTTEALQDIINDYKCGMKIKDICYKYQVGRSSIFNYLRKEGIIRNRHENK